MAPCYTRRMDLITQARYHDERITMIAGQIAALSRSLDDIHRAVDEIRQHVKALELMQPPAARRPWQFDEDRLDNAA